MIFLDRWGFYFKYSSSKSYKTSWIYCQVKDIFEAKTISNLEKFTVRNQELSFVETEQGLLSGEIDFLPIQEWFLASIKEKIRLNQTIGIKFSIQTPTLDIDKLNESISKLVAHHDVLRMQYSLKASSNTWKQVYNKGINYS